jgi:hypothetical protein
MPVLDGAPKIQHSHNKNQLLDPIPSQFNPVHTSIKPFTHLNVIPSSTEQVGVEVTV